MTDHIGVLNFSLSILKFGPKTLHNRAIFLNKLVT